jgi:hypothetical protein
MVRYGSFRHGVIFTDPDKQDIISRSERGRQKLQAIALTRLFTMLLATCLWVLSTSRLVNASIASKADSEIKNRPKHDATYRQFSGPAQNFPNVRTWTRYDFMWNREWTSPNGVPDISRTRTLISVLIKSTRRPYQPAETPRQTWPTSRSHRRLPQPVPRGPPTYPGYGHARVPGQRWRDHHLQRRTPHSGPDAVQRLPWFPRPARPEPIRDHLHGLRRRGAFQEEPGPLGRRVERELGVFGSARVQ